MLEHMLEHIYDVLACAVLTLLVLSVVYELCTHWFFSSPLGATALCWKW